MVGCKRHWASFLQLANDRGHISAIHSPLKNREWKEIAERSMIVQEKEDGHYFTMFPFSFVINHE